MSVSRIYVEKKAEFAVEARAVLSDLQTALRLNVTNVRIFNRYDADHLTEEAFQRAIPTVFSEPAVDHIYTELPALEPGQRMFATEYLPGQLRTVHPDPAAGRTLPCPHRTGIRHLRQPHRRRVRPSEIVPHQSGGTP